MPRTSMTSIVATISIGSMFLMVPGVHGHAMQIKPVSRQYWRTRVFNDGSEVDIEKHADAYNGGGPPVVKQRQIARTDPAVLEKYGGGEVWPWAAAWDLGEICPNGNYLENDDLAVSHGVCGDTPQSGDDNPIIYSTPNADWPVLEHYGAGSILDIEIVLTNYHWGHIEMFLCNAADMDDPDGVVKQSCFNKYPLDRAADDSSNSPVDPDYPGRYYVDPQCRGETGETEQERPEMEGVLNDGYINHMRYQLPDIVCDRCILQMRYHSGTGCKSPGYDEFDPPSWPSKCAPNKEDWIALGSAECRKPGAKYGNVFWACSDLSLKASSGDSPDNPPPSPTEPEETPETKPPVAAEPAGEPAADPTADPVDPTPSPVEDAGPTPTAPPLNSPETPAPVPEPTSVPEATPTEKPATPTAAPDDEDSSPNEAPVADPTPNPDGTPDPAMPPTPDTSPADCAEPVEAYEQCGGTGWTGSECCNEGYDCVVMEECYAQCRPNGIVQDWEQCGGMMDGGAPWIGSTRCLEGATCVMKTKNWSMCQPDDHTRCDSEK